MAEGLRAAGFSTPQIYAHRIDDGLALIEDFGDETVAGPDGPNPSRFTEATSLLAQLHARTLPSELPVGGENYQIPTYDLEAMLIEVELALDWYAPAVARGAPSSGARVQFVGLWREALAPVLAGPDDLDLARLSFAESALAGDARGRQAARADRFPGCGARSAGL